MSGFLVDTNVISEFIKPQPDPRVIGWLDAADPESLFASVVTFGEIRLGIEDLPAGKRRAALDQWFEQGLPAWFDSHLLPVTRLIADRWAGSPLRLRGGYFAHNCRRSDCRHCHPTRSRDRAAERDRFRDLWRGYR